MRQLSHVKSIIAQTRFSVGGSAGDPTDSVNLSPKPGAT